MIMDDGICPPISPRLLPITLRIAGMLRAWRGLRATADAFVSLETSFEISPSEDTPRTRTPPGGSEVFEKRIERIECVAPWLPGGETARSLRV